MSFVPLLKIPYARGWTELHNFPGNNWEISCGSPRLIQASWAADEQWHSVTLGMLNCGESRRIQSSDLAGLVPADATPFLSLSLKEFPAHSNTLTASDLPKVHLPAWRATVGLVTDFSRTSYQGEVDPFPSTGTMMTFGPFVQFEPQIQNYLLMLNLEKKATLRVSQLEVYKADCSFMTQFPVRNNALNVIELDGCGLKKDGGFLSMEHAHPPASMVLHGQRWLEKVSP